MSLIGRDVKRIKEIGDEVCYTLSHKGFTEVNIPVQVAKEIQGEVVESKRVGEE